MPNFWQMTYIHVINTIGTGSWIGLLWIITHYDNMTSIWIMPPLFSLFAYIAYGSSAQSSQLQTIGVIIGLILTSCAVIATIILAIVTQSEKGAILLYILNIVTSFTNIGLSYQFFRSLNEPQPIADPQP